MARDIMVTPEQLRTVSGKIHALAEAYKTSYDSLYGETGKLAETWNGKDHLAYTDQIAGFKDDFDKMHGLMEMYANFLENSAQAYETTQDGVVAQARKLVN